MGPCPCVREPGLERGGEKQLETKALQAQTRKVKVFALLTSLFPEVAGEAAAVWGAVHFPSATHRCPFVLAG